MAEGEEAGQPTPLAKALSTISAFGPPVAVATALLVYFGWARSDAQARAMGLDVSLFGYTVQDYVLRSISSLFLPLVLLSVVTIAWLAADTWLAGHAVAGRHRFLLRGVARGAIYVGVLVAGVGLVVSMIQPAVGALVLPYVMAAGVLLAAWGVQLRRLGAAQTAARGPQSGLSAMRTHHKTLESALVFSLVTLLLFWGTADFAQAVGRGLAVQVQQNVRYLPRATIYSATRLAVGAPNVSEQVLGTKTEPLFKYQGLRLLVLSGGRFFFLEDGWTLQHGTVVILPDNDSIRVELGN